MRNNITSKQVKMLYASSGGICAFPGCMTRLVNQESGALMGEICHIHATSPGGPRYNASQESDERQNINNLIILCPTHHSLVDQDPLTYTADVLRNMKKEHETKVLDSVSVSKTIIQDSHIADFIRQIDEVSIDFAIIVALPKELKALMHYFPELQPCIIKGMQSRKYYFGYITTPNGKKYKVVATLLNSMGNLEASSATSELIGYWNPRYLIVNGIAGGINSSNQKLGDIIISDSIIYYEIGKINKAGYEQRTKQFSSDKTLLNGARNFQDDNWKMRLIDRPDGKPKSNMYPSIHLGPVASGEKIIASSVEVSRLLKYQPNLIAVEMESAGVASAAFSALKNIGCIAIRSICDFADESKNDDWQIYAAHAAASFLRSFLLSQPVSFSEGKLPTDIIPHRIDNNMNIDKRRHLFNQICKALDIEEFKNFCFLIGIDIDDLPGDRKSSRVRELILLFERHGEIDVLEAAVEELVSFKE